MSKWILARSEPFGPVECDFWQNDHGDLFMTIMQLSQALGYASRDGVEKMVERNSYLGDREFSVTDKLSATDGKHYETRIFTEDGIYEVSMLSKTPKAREFRAWVREVIQSIRKHGAFMTPQKIEDVLLNPDTIILLATQLKQEREVQQQLQARIDLDKPKVIFAEALQVSKDSILIGELAKILKQNGVEMGEKRLFEQLRQLGYLGIKGDYYNIPTQRAMELKLFEIQKRVIAKPDGTTIVSNTTHMTGKGQLYFVNKFKHKFVGA